MASLELDLEVVVSCLMWMLGTELPEKLLLLSIEPSLKLHDFTFIYFLLFFMCTSLLPTCMKVHHMLAWCLKRLEEGVHTLPNGSYSLLLASMWTLGTEPEFCKQNMFLTQPIALTLPSLPILAKSGNPNLRPKQN